MRFSNFGTLCVPAYNLDHSVLQNAFQISELFALSLQNLSILVLFGKVLLS